MVIPGLERESPPLGSPPPPRPSMDDLAPSAIYPQKDPTAAVMDAVSISILILVIVLTIGVIHNDWWMTVDYRRDEYVYDRYNEDGYKGYQTRYHYKASYGLEGGHTVETTRTTYSGVWDGETEIHYFEYRDPQGTPELRCQISAEMISWSFTNPSNDEVSDEVSDACKTVIAMTWSGWLGSNLLWLGVAAASLGVVLSSFALAGKINRRWGMITAIAAGVLINLGWYVWMIEFPDLDSMYRDGTNFSYGLSFVIAVISGILGIASGVCIMVNMHVFKQQPIGTIHDGIRSPQTSPDLTQSNAHEALVSPQTSPDLTRSNAHEALVVGRSFTIIQIVLGTLMRPLLLLVVVFIVIMFSGGW